MWDALVNISRTENKQSGVLRTDNQQSFIPISNKIQDLRFTTHLNPLICVHHCHYRRDLGEARYQLRPSIFRAVFQNKRSNRRTMLGFYIPHCFKLRSRQASRAKQQTLPCFLFKQSIRLYRMRRVDDKIRQ